MLDFLFSSKGRVSRRELWLRFVLPMNVGFILVGLVESSIRDIPVGSIGPYVLAYNTLMLWPLSVIIGKRIQDRGLNGWLYVRHARIWFLLLSLAIATGALGYISVFYAVFAVVMVYQFAYLKVLTEVLQSFWSPGQVKTNEFGPRPD